jgi:hypothetical protein
LQLPSKMVDTEDEFTAVYVGQAHDCPTGLAGLS